MNLIRWNPFEEFDHLFKTRTPSFSKGGALVADWAPSVDIVENEKEFLIKAELPEVKREDVKVSIEDNVLTVRGERKFEGETKRENYHRVERSYGEFMRSFTLPNYVDASKVSADFKDGMLNVILPTRAESKPKQMEIAVK